MESSSLSAATGLSQSVINKIVAVFAQYSSIEKAVIYGSRAKGNYRIGSDIDIALYGEQLTYEQLSKVETVLDDLLLPYTMDICIFSHIESQSLLEHINRVGKVFYQRAEE